MARREFTGLVRRTIIGLAAGLAAMAAAGAARAQEPSIYGVWINHAKNVKVETKACGQLLCGTIVWASPQALQAAREAGTDSLVGLQLLTGYHQSGNEWEGRVFVPDLKRTFYSRIYRVASDKIRISGCILGGLICKYQTWTRTDD